MGRMAALEENGFKKGTEEYEYWYDNFRKLEGYLWDIRYKGITKNRCFNISYLLRRFENKNIEFTVGNMYYRDLNVFVTCGYEIFKNDFIKAMLEEYYFFYEINPMSYGYESKEFKNLVMTIKDILKK